MKVFDIKKKSGGSRKIYSPSHVHKAQLRVEVIKLNKRVLEECNMDIVHGFALGRSPVTNALKHRGFKFTLCVDLKDFFESVTPAHIKGLTDTQKKVCFVNGHRSYSGNMFLGQGFPTSPALANLACIELDKSLATYGKKNDIVYTRYADDLSFSCNDVKKLKHLRDKILPGKIHQYKFQLNPKKTRIQYSGFGRRNITGVMVDDKVYVPRDIRRRLRVAKHKHRKHQVHGLTEWSKLKLPKEGGSDRLSKVKKNLTRHIARRMQGKGDKWERWSR